MKDQFMFLNIKIIKTILKTIFYLCLLALAISLLSGCCSIKETTKTKTETRIESDTSYTSGEVRYIIKKQLRDTIFPLKRKTSIKITLRDSLVFHNSSQTVISLLHTDTSFLYTDHSWSYAGVDNGELYHYLEQENDTLQQVIDSLYQIINTEKVTEIVTETVKEKKSWLKKVFEEVGIYLFLALLVYVLVIKSRK